MEVQKENVIDLRVGDSKVVLKDLAENSIDAVVTDPPYGLAFMGKKWDYDVPSVELWREVFRVLKPGGHLLSFGGTRTYHRMVVNIEDAGFEIRDQLQWIYGSGFPKSLDVSKAIDKAAGAEREVVGEAKRSGSSSRAFQSEDKTTAGQHFETAPATDSAKQWQGWGTALKPANEPIVLARKPIEKGLTIAENVVKWGTGALNIDGSRIEATDQAALAKNWDRSQSASMEGARPAYGKFGAIDLSDRAPQGRWPANVLFDEEAAAMLDEQSGVLKSGARKATVKKDSGVTFQVGGVSACESSEGGASRFFYVAKASKRERNVGLEGLMPTKSQGARPNSADPSGKFPDHDHRDRGANNHPTVKPVKLMEYLISLITPPAGIILDPFMGSGSTGVAAKALNHKFIGIELSEEYFQIAEKRIGA